MGNFLKGASSMDTTESSNLIPKIVGGNPADEGQYPYQASLRFRNQHFCGGSIIDKRWILTASHCLSKYAAIGKIFYIIKFLFQQYN